MVLKRIGQRSSEKFSFLTFTERPDTDVLHFHEHRLIHFGSLQPDVVALLLVQHLPQLYLCLLRQIDFRHFAFQLLAPKRSLLVRLQNVFDVLLHVEFKCLRRILTDAKGFPFVFLLFGNLFALRNRRLMFDGRFGWIGCIGRWLHVE